MKKNKNLIGWREWVSLPGLGIPGIKAKIDTGARTSSIHASDIRVKNRRGKRYVKFTVYPLTKNKSISIECEAEVIDERNVTDSGGKSERRFFIKTELAIGSTTWEIDLTLSNRDRMKFRMLLGREALAGNVTIDPGRSYLSGREFSRAYDNQ